MVQRLTRKILSLFLVMVGLALGSQLLIDWLQRGQPGGGVLAPATSRSAATDIGTALLVVVFTLGLLVRLTRALRGSDPRGLREQRVDERQLRHSVRRPADDVPLEHAVPATDTDPTLDEEEGA